MVFEYIPSGVCSRHYKFDIDNKIIKSFEVIGGCNGNLQGIKSLITGMNIDDVIDKFSGIKCGFKQTSCPDQISKALKKFKEENNI